MRMAPNKHQYYSEGGIVANHKIEDVEGISEALGQQLREAESKDTNAFLANSLTPKQRKALAEKTGISEKRILKFANMVDL